MFTIVSNVFPDLEIIKFRNFFLGKIFALLRFDMKKFFTDSIS